MSLHLLQINEHIVKGCFALCLGIHKIAYNDIFDSETSGITDGSPHNIHTSPAKCDNRKKYLDITHTPHVYSCLKIQGIHKNVHLSTKHADYGFSIISLHALQHIKVNSPRMPNPKEIPAWYKEGVQPPHTNYTVRV